MVHEKIRISFKVPFILQSLTCRSSAPEIINGNVGWKQTQLTPRSWPSSTCLTMASVCPNSSGAPGAFRWSKPPGPGATFFFLKPEKCWQAATCYKLWQSTSHRTEWCKEATRLVHSLNLAQIIKCHVVTKQPNHAPRDKNGVRSKMHAHTICNIKKRLLAHMQYHYSSQELTLPKMQTAYPKNPFNLLSFHFFNC